MCGDYLTDNPSVEHGLFMDWFFTVCKWENVDPSTVETAAVKSKWYPGKSPKFAFDEMVSLRGNGNVRCDQIR